MPPEATAPYLEALNKHAGQTLTAILNLDLLPEEQLAPLLEDILEGNAAPLSPWLHLGVEPWKKDAYGPARLALDALAGQSPEWFDRHSSLLERIFAAQWEHRAKTLPGTAEHNRCQTAVASAMALVDNAQAGLGLSFLDYILSGGAPDEREELKLRLLKAKIRERMGLQILEKEVDPLLNPHLTPLKVFAYRKNNPPRAISFLIHLDDVMNAGQLQEKSLDPVRSFFATYLRQAIFNWLDEGAEEDFRDFLNRRNSIASEWFRSLFNEVMAHPALEDIHSRCEKYRNALTDKQHQSLGLAEIEKKFDL